MGNKEDWKELEQLAENKKIEKMEKFGLDIDNIDIKIYPYHAMFQSANEIREEVKKQIEI